MEPPSATELDGITGLDAEELDKVGEEEAARMEVRTIDEYIVVDVEVVGTSVTSP